MKLSPYEVKQELEARGLLDIAISIAAQSYVKLEDLLGRRRTHSVAAARRKLFTELANKGLSSGEIANALGRDGSTVRYVVLGDRARRVAPLAQAAE